MDLGPSTATAETDEQLSNTSSEERTRSATPQKSAEIAPFHDQENSTTSFRDGKRIGREESPQSETQGWVPNKVPKLNSSNSKTIDQQSTEATMRKARVSVRARSEAPMVCHCFHVELT